jgi:hypothetical protein
MSSFFAVKSKAFDFLLFVKNVFHVSIDEIDILADLVFRFVDDAFHFFDD